MGWALDNLSADARLQIARSCFKANDRTDTVGSDTWLNGLCPLHEDKKQSFGYNVTKDVFHCLAVCSQDGDLVDLWCEVNGYGRRSREGFKAFKTKFAADAGVGAPARKTPAQMKPREKPPAPAPEPARLRSIPEDLFRTFEPIPDAMLEKLRQRRGWSREAIEEAGVRILSHFRKKSDLYSLFPIKERSRLALPVRDENGVLWNIRLYYPFSEDVPDEGQKIMSWGKGHGHARLFPSPALMRPDGPVWLCEGEADTLCGRSNALNAFTQTSKTSHWPSEHLAVFAGREVYIVYDADQPGMEYARKAAKSLLTAQCRVKIIEWPDYMGRLPDGTWPEKDGQDLTDFFVKHGKTVADLLALANAAPYYGEESGMVTTQGFPRPWLQFFGTSASGRYTFRERALADYLLKQCPMLYHDKSGQLFRWDGTYFEPFSEEQLKRTAIEALGEEATASRVNSSCSLAMSLVSMPHGRDLNDRPEWVCLLNGMFNLYTLELLPHTQDFLATIKLPITWRGAEAKPPARWLQFLEQTIQTPGVIHQAQEFAGYSLTRETRYGKSLLLFGPGSDGKSKFIAVLRALVGAQNCSAVSMTGLDDQFQRAALFGKVLNVATEITTDAIQSEMFKAIVTGDPIQASFKHKDSFEFTPYCKLVYATNKMPRVFDNSDGYFRRLLPIQFKRQFLENDPEMDTDLEEKLMQELDSIFAWAVMGLHRLKEQKRFTTCDETLDFMMRYRRYNNPVMAFVQDKCILGDAQAEAQLKDLYKAYKEYCSEGGFRPANRENFFEELQTACRKLNEDAAIRRHRPRRGTERPDVVAGIRLHPNPDLPI